MKKYKSKFKNVLFLNFAFCILHFAFSMYAPLQSYAEDIYQSRLNKGLKNTEAYSYVLIKKAQADPSNATDLLTEAIRYSPNLPAAYFAMARASFSMSAEGMFESLDYAIEGIKAYERNFWWLVSIAGLSIVSLAASLVIALLTVLLIRFFIESPLLSHDIKEDWKKAFIVLFLVPLSSLGPLFFIAGALFLFGLYFSRTDKIVVYVSILILFLSPSILRFANIFVSASSPELRAIVDVNENRDNKYAISALKGKSDFASIFSYGLALKREGYYAEAVAAYRSLPSSPFDRMVYVNLGNCYFAMNDMSAAKDFYNKSIDIRPSAAAYYNLSQVSREMLDFANGEKYFLEATKLGRESVSRFSGTSSRNPNRFVIDEVLPMSALWGYAESKALRLINISSTNSLVAIAVSIALFLLFYIIDSRIQYRAYRCRRCRIIICGKCEKRLFWGQMCSRCYKSLVKLDELDSRERVARLLQVQEIQQRRRNIIGVLSFAPPGVVLIYAGKILAGSLLLWAFMFLLGLVLLNPLFPTGLSLFSHSWLKIPSLILMAALYLISNFSVRRRINRGWL